jgi:light-regulated signal transduction histidine kinase (bacteriophytochrome)
MILLVLMLFNILSYFFLAQQTKKKISLPIKQLSTALSEGQLKLDYSQSNIKEIEVLETSFTQLVDHLRNRERELKRFVYVASHDLKEPLRVITNYIQILESELSDDLNDTQAKYLNYVVNGARRQKNLIDGLLAYSRASELIIEKSMIDLDEILKEISMDLRMTIKEKEANLIYEDLGSIYGDYIGTQQVLENIIHNALKFNENKPFVTVFRDNQGLHILDNGIGIDESQISEMIKPFRRLKTKEEYPGTGIGLSIVSTILEKHGWTFDVKSTLGQGTEFIIKLEE